MIYQTYLATGALLGFIFAHYDFLVKDETPYTRRKRISLFIITVILWFPMACLGAIGKLIEEFIKEKEKTS